MKKAAGFALIEVMVVLGIIGVLIGGVAVSMGGQYASFRLRADADRVVGALSGARTEALLRNTPISVTVNGKTFRFEQFNAETNKWEALTLPPLTVELSDATHMKLKELEEKIIFQPSWQFNPFTVQLTHGSTSTHIEGNAETGIALKGVP